jgi:hypothetical protein
MDLLLSAEYTSTLSSLPPTAYHVIAGRGTIWGTIIEKAQTGPPGDRLRSGLPRRRDLTSKFRKLGLDEQSWGASNELKEWCRQNKNRCYISEQLLKEWGIAVDHDIGS